MLDELQLNVALLKRRVPNLTSAAKAVGLRPATVSNLCTGKIPVGRAEVRTLVALANIAGCTLDELIIQGAGTERIELGIKVLDLFAPLVHGGTAGLVARPGMGQLVLMGEVLYRLKQLHYTTLFLMPTAEVVGIEDVLQNADYYSSNLEEIKSYVQALKTEQEVVIGVDRTAVITGDIYELRDQLQHINQRQITMIVVDTLGEAVDEDTPYGPLETLWRFDMDLATRNLFPAVDSVISTSTILEGSHLENVHLTIQQRARKLLRRYKELRFIVQTRGIEKLHEVDLQVYHRGQRIEAFLTQPFYIAEPITKQQGEWVTPADTLEDVRRILEGAADEIKVEQLRYIGGLDV